MNARGLALALAVAALGALAGAGAPLGHVAPVPPNVAGVTVRLPACRPVDAGVPEALPADATEGVSGDVAAAAGIGEAAAGSATLAGLPWHGALTAFAGPVAGTAPVYAALADRAADVWLSPFLGPVEVWSGGPLGMLEREALAAREAGDMAGFEALAAEHRRKMERALKRRAVHARKVRGAAAE